MTFLNLLASSYTDVHSGESERRFSNVKKTPLYQEEWRFEQREAASPFFLKVA